MPIIELQERRGVEPVAAIDYVCAFASDDIVIAVLAIELVVASEPEQGIVAAASEHDVAIQRIIETDERIAEFGKAELLDRNQDVALRVARRLRRVLEVDDDRTRCIRIGRHIDSITAIDRIRTVAARERIVALVAEQAVNAIFAEQVVIAAATPD